MKSDEMLHSYRQHGYLIVPDLIDVGDVRRINREICDIGRGKYKSNMFTPFSSSLSDEEVTNRIHCIHQGHYLSPLIMDYFKDPRVVVILKRLIGPNIKGLFSLLFVKPPGCQGAAWHQDEIYSATRDGSLTGVLIALDDMDQENGCLRMIPKAHGSGIIFRTRPHGNSAEYDDSADESFGFDESKEVLVEISAGTAVFFNGYTIHKSMTNRSSRCRRAVVNHYMNAGSPLLTGAPLKQGETPISFDDRRITMIAGEDPYSWKGSFQPEDDIAIRTCEAMQALL
jgi:phytanoyl-CoA hydroxylase